MKAVVRIGPRAGAAATVFLLVACAVVGCSAEDVLTVRPGPPPDLAGRFQMASDRGRYFDVDPGAGVRLTTRSETADLNGMSGKNIICVMLTDRGLELHPDGALGRDLSDLLTRTSAHQSALLVLDGAPLCEVWLAEAQTDNDTDPFLTYQLENAAEMYDRLKEALAESE